MLIMEKASSSHSSSPLSEHDTAQHPWLRWQMETCSVSELNLDSASELGGLVEDKEIAARAVAFVVNSTRKGIVPLCADIANLFRAKRGLEKKLCLLKRENEVLRESTGNSFHNSDSSSPVTPSTGACCTHSSQLSEQGTVQQEQSCPCSRRCSQCSSTLSNSPELLKTISAEGNKADHLLSEDCNSCHSLQKPRQGLPVELTAPEIAQNVTEDKVQNLASHCCVSRKHSSQKTAAELEDKVSLERCMVSKETQCTLEQHWDLLKDEQLSETICLNFKLEQELALAKKDIEILKSRLKELEINHLSRDSWREPLHMSNTGNDTTLGEERPVGLIDPYDKLVIKRHRFQNGCKLRIQVGDHVMTKGQRTGCIRCIGRLDKIAQPTKVFVGLELDAPVGKNDGCFNGKRYFFCSANHGLFLPVQDIICKVQQKSTSKENCVQELQTKEIELMKQQTSHKRCKRVSKNALVLKYCSETSEEPASSATEPEIKAGWDEALADITMGKKEEDLPMLTPSR